MNTKEMDIEEIKPYWRNPKRNEDVIPKLKESIKKFGYKAPIIVDEDDEIIAGHARYQALLKLKGEIEVEDIENEDLKENLEKVNEGNIPVLVADDLTEEKVKEYRITDNKLSEYSEWEREKLQKEARELIDNGIIGFTDEELDALLEDKDIDFDEYEVTDKELEQAKKNLEQENNQEIIYIKCPHCKEKIGLDEDKLKEKGLT